MHYIQVEIHVKREGIEPVTAALMGIDINEIMVDDLADIDDLLKKEKGYEWDYIDDSVLQLQNEKPKITVFMDAEEFGLYPPPFSAYRITSIALEELAQVGATTFLRIGTCGTFQDFIKNGDIIVFDSACRYDGASKAYAPIEYPAAAHYQMINACVSACENLGYTYHVGATRTADTFFAGHPRPGSSFNNYWHSSWEHYFEDLKRMNVYGAEMEASIIMVLARLWGLRAGGIAVTLDNMLTVSGEDGNFDPETQLDHSQDAIEKLSKAGCEALYQIWQKDQAAAR